jgi:hypothetical protein
MVDQIHNIHYADVKSELEEVVLPIILIKVSIVISFPDIDIKPWN